MLDKKRTFAHTLILLVFMVSLLSGCHAPAGRSAGDVVDDSTITSLVKAKLFDSEELSGFAVSVSTFEQVVTLTGAVDTERQRALAEEIARSVQEVRGVNNLLKIK